MSMEKNDQLFMQLLYLLHHSAMQELGKVQNPMTNKVERNLPQAKQLIDTLEMLKEKTNGNLSEELSKAQEMMLSELRLNYVDELNKEEDGTAGE
jgi:F0F1-type ATP synthase membrane subunit b/b'